MTDEEEDRLYWAIEKAMHEHDALKNDSVCRCGVRNNMDGDVLASHRAGAMMAAVTEALGLKFDSDEPT